MSTEPKAKSRIIGNVAAILISAILTNLLAKLIDRLLPYLTAFWSVWWFTAIGTVVVLLIGVGLFLFRKNYQPLYGLSEVGFGLTVLG
jgi:hypothetical protein